MWNIHPTRSRYALLAQYLSPLDARIEAGLLESEGIEVMLLDENIVWNNQMYAQAVGGVKLLVNQDELTRAQEILADYHHGDFGINEEGEPAAAEQEPVTENSKEDYVNIGFVFLIFLTLGLAIPFKALHHRLKEKKNNARMTGNPPSGRNISGRQTQTSAQTAGQPESHTDSALSSARSPASSQSKR